MIFKKPLAGTVMAFSYITGVGVAHKKKKFGEIEIGRFICGNQAVVDRRGHDRALVATKFDCIS